MTSIMPGGYAGKLLRVDLTNEKFIEEQLDETTLRKYLGGAGFGAKYLYEEVPPDLDCFTEDEAQALGLRIVNIARVYNFRLGHDRGSDSPSPRYGSAPVDGPIQGRSIVSVLDNMLDSYYEKMGWDKKTGKPFPETLETLGLTYLTKDIWVKE